LKDVSPEVLAQRLIEAFKTFDKDGKGTITIPKLRYILQCLGDKLDDNEADEFVAFCMAKCMPEGDTGEFNYEEIVEQLMEKNPNNA